jgi:hypothetical protein
MTTEEHRLAELAAVSLEMACEHLQGRLEYVKRQNLELTRERDQARAELEQLRQLEPGGRDVRKLRRRKRELQEQLYLVTREYNRLRSSVLQLIRDGRLKITDELAEDMCLVLKRRAGLAYTDETSEISPELVDQVLGEPPPHPEQVADGALTPDEAR